MPRLIIILLLMAMMVSSASGQVDTLMLVEVNSIDIIDDITKLYTKDLNSDGNEEIILCTAHFVYIYDSSNNQLLWTSPTLTNPDDLLFEDINHDGLLDISLRDNLNIYLFDPHNYQTIWTSPYLDSTYKCYTIGDRNDDGWTDVAIVSKEPFVRYGDPDNLDTVWVDLYDGLSFTQNADFVILMPNYTLDGTLGIYKEDPDKIIIDVISGSSGLQTTIIVFSFKNDFSHFPASSSWHRLYAGNCWLINAIDFNSHCIYDTGYLKFHDIIYNNGFRLVCSLNYKSITDFSGGFYQYSISKFINTLSYDTLLSKMVLWEWADSGYMIDAIDWNGFIIGEIYDNNNQDEIYFVAQDSIYLYTFPDLNILWNTVGALEIEEVSYIFYSSVISDNAQIICYKSDPFNQYVFFNGSDGLPTAVLPSLNTDISHVSDLDGDGNDELLSIQGNSLFIYHLDYYVDVDKSVTLPHSTFLQPNYPNPFNNSTAIMYGLDNSEHVLLEIFDLLGRKVETLVNEHQSAGLYQKTWNANNTVSGIYFYRLTADDYTKTRKMLLVK